MLFIIGLIICLIFIVYQDWTLRQIHIALPLCLALLAYSSTNKTLSLFYILYNMGFFALVFGAMTLYMCIKNKKWVNPLKHYFGLGDVLFYLALSPMFFVYQYGIFFIASMLFAIVIHFFFQRFYKHATIPLAGYAAVLLIGFIVYDYFNVEHKMTMLQWQK